MTILDRPEPDRTGARRRWTIPVPPPRNVIPFEGARLLDEIRPAALAHLLWHCLRAVQLWSDTEPARRPDLFAALPVGAEEIAAGAAAAEIAADLRPLLRLIESPETAEASELSAAAENLSAWAARAGHPATEAEYAEAAASLRPESADAALFAGRAARRSGNLSRAQAWYHRASGLARRSGDRAAFVLSLIRRGIVAEEQGDTERAKRLQAGAWKAARRFKLDKLAAYAQHERLVIAVHSASLEEGQRYASAALRLYGRFDDRFPQLAHDTAFLWAWHGYHAPALPIYRAVLPFLERASERLQVIANIGRAAAAAGDREGYFEAWEQIEAGISAATEHAPTAFLNLGLGAHTLGLRNQAGELARRALDTARARGQATVIERAEELLRNVPTAAGRDANHPATPEMLELSARLLGRLERAAGKRG